MRFNSRGDLIEGRERYWLNDDVWIEQVGTDATGWHVQASDGTILDPHGASELKAGGNKWAAYPPPRGNFGPIPSAGIILDISFAGIVAWCADRQVGTPVGIFGEQEYPVTPRTTRVVGPGHFVCAFYDGRVWSNRRGYANTPRGVRAFSAQLIDDWLLYYSDRHLVLQHFDEPLGIVLADAPTYSPDMVRLPDGRLKIAWAPNPAEMAPHIVFVEHPQLDDLTDLTDSEPQEPPMPTGPSAAEQQRAQAALISVRAELGFGPNQPPLPYVRAVAQALGYPWGLNGKRGNPADPSGDILAWDIPGAQPQLYDVLGDAGGANTPQFSALEYPQPAGAVFLPVGSVPPPPDGPPQPPSGATIDAQVRALIEAAVSPLRADIAALKAQQPSTPAPVTLTGRRVSLKTFDGHYVCAEGGGGGEVNATRTAVGGWETLTIEER